MRRVAPPRGPRQEGATPWPTALPAISTTYTGLILLELDGQRVVIAEETLDDLIAALRHAQAEALEHQATGPLGLDDDLDHAGPGR